jgi:hypothetical protein
MRSGPSLPADGLLVDARPVEVAAAVCPGRNPAGSGIRHAWYDRLALGSEPGMNRMLQPEAIEAHQQWLHEKYKEVRDWLSKNEGRNYEELYKNKLNPSLWR